MKKAVTANIGGTVFQIDEDACDLLENYLRRIENGYANLNEGKEIAGDLESRISEMLEKRTNGKSRAVTIEDINWAISIVGSPEDIGAHGHTTNHQQSWPYKVRKRLYRDVDNRVIGGVCTGLGIYFDVDPVLIRVLFVVMLFVGFGPLFYIILWIAVPKARTITQKLEMHGEPPTPENIKKYSF